MASGTIGANNRSQGGSSGFWVCNVRLLGDTIGVERNAIVLQKLTFGILHTAIYYQRRSASDIGHYLCAKTIIIMKTIKKILVSQPRPLSTRNPYVDMETEFGVECDFKQLIKIEGLSVREFRDQHVYLEEYTAVIVNSRLGIDHYFRLAEETRFAVPESMHYYCISEAVGNYLQKYIQYRKRKVFVAENNRFEDLLPAMHRRPQEKYLMVLSDVHNDDDLNMFAENNIVVKPAIMYRTVANEWPADKPFDYDMIVLFTPSGVAALRKNFPDWMQGDTVIACFGANTAIALEEAGFRVDIKAPSEKYQSITTAIKDYLEEHQEK